MKDNILKEIDKQRKILNNLIVLEAPYNKIVKQSQKLDNYILDFYKTNTRVK